MTFPPQDWQYPPVPSPYAPGPVAQPEPPAALRRAVAFMYAGAAISFVSTVVSGAVAFNLIKTAGMFSRIPGAPVLAFAIISGLVPCGLWLWMAWKTGAGREWARVLSTIFFGFMSLELIPSVLVRASGVSSLGSVAEWLAGLVALILLYRQESSQFFAITRYSRAMRQYPPQYPPPPGYGQQPPVQ